MRDVLLMILVAALPLGCGSGVPEWASGKGLIAGPGTGARSLAEQMERGALVYAESCADCHGERGEGSRAAPPLVGPDALPREPREDGDHTRAVELRTGGDLLAFMEEAMPLSDPGSLSRDEYLDVLVLLLHANGAELPDRLLTARSSRAIRLRRGPELPQIARWW